VSRRTSRARGAIALTAALGIGPLGCADGHVADPEPAQAFRGTWEVVTVLDSFAFEVSRFDAPAECGTSPYCTIVRPATGATLRGTLVLADTASRDATDSRRLSTVRGTFTGRHCAEVDRVSLTGCRALGPTTTMEFTRAFGPSGNVSTDVWAMDGQLFTAEPVGPILAFRDGRMTGQVMTGRIYWARVAARGPDAFSGTFTARRISTSID
jgi:hypothetical protein